MGHRRGFDQAESGNHASVAALVAGVLAAAALLVAVFGSHWLSPGDPFYVLLVGLPAALVLAVVAILIGKNRPPGDVPAEAGIGFGIIVLGLAAVGAILFLILVSGVG